MAPSVAWLAITLIGIIGRTLWLGIVQHSRIGAIVRVRTVNRELVVRCILDRLVALALVWAIAATIWIVALHVGEIGGIIAAAGSGAGAALFAALRDWFPRAMRPGKQVGITKKIVAFIPQLLAYLVIGLALVAVCLLIQVSIYRRVELSAASVAVAVPIAAVVILGLAFYFFDPVNVGIHSFYRDRICRAYLGASNAQGEAPSMNTEVRLGDDILLSDTQRRPLHLICCAANQLDFDPLSNFARGAKSATISRLGIAIGDHWAECPELMLSSAVTASAAAFNPAMGSVSKQLGPAVTFLMCALGLRLGLWINRPNVENPGRLRRRAGLFYRELFGLSDPQQIHLSDGAHFENLGLYELVRRHCRYIIASDCGADPNVAFDDLANAMRRIREDFGVEIELDTRPLKPGPDGLARQHMVVGTIHYDRLEPSRSDKGIFLYFKPNLTGDEPNDVRQYATRNSDFPNETTVDQFYDEAQWESYRRLGEHAARSALRFLESHRSAVLLRDQFFVQARREWYPTPDNLADQFIKFSERFAALEERLRSAPAGFLDEIYPELNQPEPPVLTPVQKRSVFALLVQMIQLMEDLYIGCNFDETRGHPLNAGWMNLFALDRRANFPTLVAFPEDLL